MFMHASSAMSSPFSRSSVSRGSSNVAPQSPTDMGTCPRRCVRSLKADPLTSRRCFKELQRCKQEEHLSKNDALDVMAKDNSTVQHPSDFVVRAGLCNCRLAPAARWA